MTFALPHLHCSQAMEGQAMEGLPNTSHKLRNWESGSSLRTKQVEQLNLKNHILFFVDGIATMRWQSFDVSSFCLELQLFRALNPGSPVRLFAMGQGYLIFTMFSELADFLR